jgi:hypothetical protein
VLNTRSERTVEILPPAPIMLLKRCGAVVVGATLLMLIGCSSPPASTALVGPPSSPTPRPPTDVIGTTPAASIPNTPPHATVWLFISTDCPICNNYQPEIERLRARYTPLGIEFIGVYAEVPVSAAEVADHIRQFAIAYPIVVDDNHVIRKRFGVRFVPEVIVTAGGRGATIDPLAFLYRGRIDDQYPERGSRRPSATTHDLNDALRDITQGRAPAARVTTPVGCVLEP